MIHSYVGLVGFSLMLYDYFLTLPDEIEFIWNSPLSTVKVAFLLNRYGNQAGQVFIQAEEVLLISHGSHSFCVGLNTFSTAFLLFAAATVHNDHFQHLKNVQTCVRNVSGRRWIRWMTWYVPITKTPYTLGMARMLTRMRSVVIDIVIFVFTMHSLRQLSKENKGVYPSRLRRVLFRDTILLFLVSVFIDTFAVLTWSVYEHDPRYFLYASFSMPLLCVSGQRLVLNLRALKQPSFTTQDLSKVVDYQLRALEARANDRRNQDPPYSHQRGGGADEEENGGVEREVAELGEEDISSLDQEHPGDGRFDKEISIRSRTPTEKTAWQAENASDGRGISSAK
ncbi:hypothetical protein CONPUDRAFT_169553 [Coniophora puteana RWD-64-598 SS2]|uniref:DUF6533 domain-containing protein n=1 Tax=Coniophora puteana (strain RWD-64-598) TaxID=741705 RepID=A0A5M3M8M8_CONPW|nr:uncharacterized protein CONPUDRAFT_169553 [Coniophora puteana RWD-64-598 SS2]EIW75135.1 hypothetical protein CONPUDRAFT_169553 [Coniophora puteana RWD-64-598 SS2]